MFISVKSGNTIDSGPDLTYFSVMTEHTVRRVVIAGGTGFLGQSLSRHLTHQGVQVTVVSRRQPANNIAGRWIQWDGRSSGTWEASLDGADAVVNLAGRTVDCRKTPDRCDEILRSRVESVLTLGEAIRQCDNPPSVWVQGATAHIYGDPPNRICDESTPSGYGLAPYVGRRWEEAFAQACPPGIRSVVLRTSFVLGATGGALPILARLARLGLGGSIGSGRQWISWLHAHDMNRIIERAIDEPSMQGVYNATAPSAATNQQFMRALRQVARRPIGLPTPGWLVRLGAKTLIDTDPEIVLYGRNCVPKRLLDEGYRFAFPSLSKALADLLS